MGSLFTNNAQADQGLYGNIYAYTEELGSGEPDLDNNSAHVSGAIVEVYNNSNEFITSTTASACGYYTVSLSPGQYKIRIYHQYYTPRVAYYNGEPICGSTLTSDHLTDLTDPKTVWPSIWTKLNAFTW